MPRLSGIPSSLCALLDEDTVMGNNSDNDVAMDNNPALMDVVMDPNETLVNDRLVSPTGSLDEDSKDDFVDLDDSNTSNNGRSHLPAEDQMEVLKAVWTKEMVQTEEMAHTGGKGTFTQWV